MNRLVNTSCPICGSRTFEMTKTEVLYREILRQKLLANCNNNSIYKTSKFIMSSSLEALAIMNNCQINDKIIDLGVDGIEYLVSKTIVGLSDSGNPNETVYQIEVRCKNCNFQIM